jgi:hypothetical protein
MAEQKKYTAREAALAVLAKAHEMLKSEHMNKPPHPTPAPMLAMSEKNPDASADAELGERIEHLCEKHMMDNKDAERKEGHKIVKSEDCMKCNMKQPNPSTGQGDLLHRPAAKAKWQMDKGEEREKEGGVDTGSKKLGYKPSKIGAEEKDQEMPSDGAFEPKGIDHKSSDDPRLGSTNDPDKDPKEHAEGNNAQPGSKPAVEANVSQDTNSIKGHMKLAKFIGRMEHKRSLSKGVAQAQMPAQQAMPKSKMPR